MKILRERQFIRILFYTLISTFVVLVAACDNEPIDQTSTMVIGTWHQKSQTTEGVLVAKDSTRLLMQINSNQICILCDSTSLARKNNNIVKRSGWSFSGGLLNIAIDIPVSWKPIVDSDKLILEKIEFNQSGKIIKTIQTYTRIADIDID